ncbi:hypothetical protein AVEN_11137-1 [Araneus ventricosus]|uniref:Uncharacterized protein n=1 Tax=Araneus ventricosus TaxID=182803 RepID=A0A4Y2U4P0_ARAVE|nr:hypothetical protein AVEN_11137-1 [Araneus ventricosus]
MLNKSVWSLLTSKKTMALRGRLEMGKVIRLLSRSCGLTDERVTYTNKVFGRSDFQNTMALMREAWKCKAGSDCSADLCTNGREGHMLNKVISP